MQLFCAYGLCCMLHSFFIPPLTPANMWLFYDGNESKLYNAGIWDPFPVMVDDIAAITPPWSAKTPEQRSNIVEKPLASVQPSMFLSWVCQCVFCCVSDVTHMMLSAISCVLFKCYWHMWHIQHIRQRCLQGCCIINAVLCVLNHKLASCSLLTRQGAGLFGECKASGCHFFANR